MVGVVITSCSNRKRRKPDTDLHAASLAVGDVRTLAREWVRRLRKAEVLHEAASLYGGRAFREAEAAAGNAGAAMFVASAGVGLVSANSMIPSYRLTITGRSMDNVLRYVNSRATPTDWWAELAD